eukprot:ANDGO_04372.mRNA.1 Eukaryotic translation initiation factor 2A
MVAFAKDGLHLLNAPNFGDAGGASNSGAIGKYANVGRFEFSPDGKYIALIDSVEDHVKLLDAATGQLLRVLDEQRVQAIAFSPLSTFLCTYRRPVDPETESVDGNVVVWACSDFRSVYRFWQKTIAKDTWPSIQWTADEGMCCRMGSEELLFLDGALRSDHVRQKLAAKSLASWSLAPSHPPAISVFCGGAKGGPSSVKIYRYPQLREDQVIVTRAFFKVDSVKVMWNSLGTALLILVQTDVDTSGKSYYGTSRLYFAGVDGTSMEVPFQTEGQIHDVAWSPNGEEFVAIQGAMPPRAICFDAKCQPIFDFGSLARNTVSFNRFGRMLVLGGFGSLPGEMDFWDRDGKKWKRLCTVRAHHPVTYSWSPCGRYFATATTFPRLKVDNNVTIWKYSGVKLAEKKFDELYTVMWRPSSKSLFPARPPSAQGRKEAKELGDKQVQNATAAVKPAPYRPPGARDSDGPSAVALMMRKENDGPRRIVTTPQQTQSQSQSQQKRA